MSIASRIQEIETHIGNAYTSIDNLGIDISNTNKNIYNISTLLDTFYESLPKVSGIGASLSLSPSLMGKIKLNEIQGDTSQNDSPTPSSPVPIQSVTGLQNVEVCGKNIFNSPIIKGVVTNDYINTSTSTRVCTQNFIKVEPNTTYTISFVSDIANQINISSFVSNTFPRSQETNWTSNFTFTTGNYNYIMISFRKSTDATIEPSDISNIQLEVGSATTYEPYKGNTYEVNLGKNLLDLSKFYLITADSGITLTNDTTTGKITLNGTTTKNTFITYLTQKFNSGEVISLSANNPVINSNVAIRMYDISSAQTSSNIDLNTINKKSEGITLNRSFDGFQVRIASGTTLSNFELFPQIEIGSTATSYSPYFTPIELNTISTYEDSIKKSTGKNLWQFSENDLYRLDATSYSILGNNSVEVTSTSGTWRSVKFLLNVPDGTYTFSIGNVINSNSSVTNKRMTLSTFTNNGATRTVVKHINMGTPETITITNGEDKIYALEFYSGHDISLSNTATYEYVQVVSGSTALLYEPYGKVWYITKNIGKVVFDGSEEWVQLTNLGWWTRKNATIIKKSGLALSNKYAYTSSTWQGNYTFSINSSGFTAISDNTYSTLTNWQNYLSSNNVEVLHQLETPTYTTITNTELIEQLETLYNAKSHDGTTNINVTSQDLAMLLNVGVLKGE